MERCHLRTFSWRKTLVRRKIEKVKFDIISPIYEQMMQPDDETQRDKDQRQDHVGSMLIRSIAW